MTAFIITLIVLLLIGFGLYYIFSLTFIRQNIDGLDDIDSSVNKFLHKYRSQVEEGMRFIDNTPQELLEVESFDGLKLYGRYYNNNNSDRTIILFHGYRSAAKRDFACAVEMYYNMGLNVLLVHQRSHGLSQGRLITFGIRESRDVLSWTEYVLKKYGEKQIILDGISMGATTVLLSARFDLPKNVKGIIADCSFTSPAEIIGEVAEKKFHIKAFIAVPLLNLMCKLFAHFDLKEFSTVEVLKENKIPVLLIHGKADGFVPCRMSEEAYAAATAKKDICLIENADHGMSFLTDRDTVVKKLESFLKEISG